MKTGCQVHSRQNSSRSHAPEAAWANARIGEDTSGSQLVVGAAKREWPGPEFLMVGGGEEMEGGSGSHFDVEILPSSPWVHALPRAYRIYLLIHKPQNSSFHPSAIRLRNNWGTHVPQGTHVLPTWPDSSPGGPAVSESLTPLLSLSFLCLSSEPSTFPGSGLRAG